MLGTSGSRTVVSRHDASSIEQDHRNVLLGAKIQPPQRRAGMVPRVALVDRMLARQEEPVVAVVAPPGYGKTTVLGEWSARPNARAAAESSSDGSLSLSSIEIHATSWGCRADHSPRTVVLP